MSKVLIGLIGTVILGAAVFLMLQATKTNHLELEGSILKVRVMDTGDGGSLVVTDFRVKNPSRVPFVVETVEMTLEGAGGEKVVGRTISKSQMETVFQSKSVIGGKFNEILSLQDRVGPGQSMDRTAAARFEVPATAIDRRKSLHLRFDEIDGAVSEIADSSLR